MLKKLKMLFVSFSALFMFAVPLAVAGVASAQIQQERDINKGLCSGSKGQVTGDVNCVKNEGSSSLNNVIRTVINVISIVVGVVAVVMIIVGGFRYVASGGKEASVTSAKNTIMYALIGLVIVALAQLIVRFLLGNLTKSETPI